MCLSLVWSALCLFIGCFHWFSLHQHKLYFKLVCFQSCFWFCFWCLFSTERILFNTYGEEQKEEQEQKEERVNQSRTRLIQIISPFLFFAPDRYLRQIRFLNWRQIRGKPEDWQKFITTLEKPWSDFILYASVLFNRCPNDLSHCFQATVLLAVNVSYLAIPGLGSSSVGQIASLCSIIASVGCIIIGSLLASEHYTAPKQGENVSPSNFWDLI